MAARVRVVQVPEVDRRELQRRVRDKGAPARVVERARIVLLAADGCQETDRRDGRLCRADGDHLAAPLHRARLGRPGGSAAAGQTVAAARVAAQSGAEVALTEPPTALEAAPWSPRLLAAARTGGGTSISYVPVAGI